MSRSKPPTRKPVKKIKSRPSAKHRGQSQHTDAFNQMLTEWAAGSAVSCSTRMSVAFMGAEMLMHLGRGLRDAELGKYYSEQSNSDLVAITAGIDIFESPDNPNKESTIEKLFLGFVTSIAHNLPNTKKQRWKTAGNADLPFIGALSYLVGNLAWQKKAGTQITTAELKAAFDAVSGQHCPSNPTAGGGPFCDWMNL